MNILVLAPMVQETANFKKALEGRKCKHHYKVITTGIGKVNAASTAALEISVGNQDLVVVIGYAAATKSLEKGSLVIPNSARYHDVNVPEGLVEELTKIYELDGNDECLILTGDSFITKDVVPNLKRKYGKNLLFDMEATAVAQVCDEFGTDLIVIKMVSDIPEVEDYESFNDFVESHTDFSVMVDWLELLG